MIAPRWIEFPHNHALDERTMFCIRIPKEQDRKKVSDEVNNLGAELLLFLRQVRIINVTVQNEDGSIKQAHELKRVDYSISGMRLTELFRTSSDGGTDTKERFIVCQRTSENMPQEDNRLGVTETDVLMAFPVDEALEPQISDRWVYNFLPIASYGFPFVLQADFMLNAPREAILGQNAWNSALIAFASRLFVESVQQFNATKCLQYAWPKYLTFRGEAYGTPFYGFCDILVRTLRNSTVLQSEASTLRRPLDLYFVPSQLSDGEKPLLTGPLGLESFANHAYSSNHLTALQVREQSTEEFVSLLHEYVKSHPEDFQRRESVWHSRLASAILAIGPDDFRSIKLIPVRGGQWLAAKGNSLFFPKIEDGSELPSGIDVQVVNDAVVMDKARKRLFSALGVSVLNEANACGLIVQQHARKPEASNSWSVDDVVEHAWFLYRADAQPSESDTRRLLVASNDGKLRRGHQTYMDVPNSTFQVSKHLGTSFPFLHKRYLDRPSQHPTQDPAGPGKLLMKWTDWLNKAVGVRILPRLAGSGTISEEFNVIIKSSQANEWLQLLKNEADAYSAELQGPENDNLRTRLANTNVLCIDGSRRPLKDVYFPTSRVLSEPLAKGHVSMVAVDDADDARWNTFEHSLRMRRDTDADLFISILLHMREGRCYFNTDDVKRMYTGIARKYSHHVK